MLLAAVASIHTVLYLSVRAASQATPIFQNICRQSMIARKLAMLTLVLVSLLVEISEQQSNNEAPIINADQVRDSVSFDNLPSLVSLNVYRFRL